MFHIQIYMYSEFKPRNASINLYSLSHFMLTMFKFICV